MTERSKWYNGLEIGRKLAGLFYKIIKNCSKNPPIQVNRGLPLAKRLSNMFL